MKTANILIAVLILVSCNSRKSQNKSEETIDQTDLMNPKIQGFQFLDCMYKNFYFPEFLVDKCKNVLINLCKNIEKKKPENLNQLYKLTHKATERINDLQDEFFQHDSEIETGARECLGANFEFISNAYGFNADVEELIASRDW